MMTESLTHIYVTTIWRDMILYLLGHDGPYVQRALIFAHVQISLATLHAPSVNGLTSTLPTPIINYLQVAYLAKYIVAVLSDKSMVRRHH
jgi:hypothetical protein